MRVSIRSETSPVWLETLFEEAPFGIAWLDTELHYRRVNARLAEINGLAAEAHVGRHLSEVVKADERLAHQIQRAMGRREAVSVEGTGESRMRPGVARRWHVSIHPVDED